MLERLPKAFTQVKTGTRSENLQSEIRKCIYSVYLEKDIIKKVYNNIMND